jgi:2-polyprenyl-6-methoxyphenol hydroxylase-like FAD-dependent oxidoreductase
MDNLDNQKKTMSPKPLAIIGAGLTGLTLSRALLSRGIPSIIYEKAASTPRHNYGITLHPSSFRPLLKTFGIDEDSFRRKVAVDAMIGGVGSVSPHLRIQRGLETGSFRASRGRLEKLLCEGLSVKWEFGVDKVEKSSRGGWVLHFRNGEKVKSEYVIAADGIHSPSRKSLLPHEKLKVLPYVVFNGKR